MRHWNADWIGIALLASSALVLPARAFAATPAPRFASPDDHGVDLTSGLPFISIEEGSIGSGPGAVRMQRFWAEGSSSRTRSPWARWMLQPSGL